MAKDLEEFLRKAAQRRQQQQQPQQQPPAQTPPPQTMQPQQSQQPKPVAQPRSTKPAKPKRAAPTQQRQNSNQESYNRESVAAHVRKNVNTDSISRQVEQLGYEVGLADDKMDARLHEKFDHSVSNLNTTIDSDSILSEGQSKSSRKQPLGILDMLRTPQTMRQAIIVAEILKRPSLD